MPEIARLLESNRAYAAAAIPVQSDGRPTRHIAVVTCMDARIDVFAALGLALGEAHVIRNAGGRVTGDVLRSLALSVHALGVESIVVMQHTLCGLAGKTDEQLQELTGAEIDFLAIEDHAVDVRSDVEALAAVDYLSDVREIAGFVYDVRTGAIDHVLTWHRPV